MSSVRIGSRTIEVDKGDKVLFPGEGLTKGEIVEYHRDVAARMLPFLRGRPLVMRRFPDGIAEAGFFQKETPDHFPDWIDTTTLHKKEGGTTTHVVANEVATTVFLADQGTIEIHALLAPVSGPDRPDQLVLDLDPSTDDVADVVAAGRAVRRVLRDLGVTGFVKSTGSRGLHVLLRLDGTVGFDEARETARSLAEAVVDRNPERFTTTLSKDDRGDRVFVDWLRNSYGQHAVAPYSVRARPGAPVAVPLDWDEATSSSFDPRRYTVRNLFRRLGQKHGDPWEGLNRHVYSVASLRERLDGIRD